MFQWLKRTCFSNLELESQKNRLLLFLMLPLLLLAELNIMVNVPIFHPKNLMFIAVYLLFYGVCFILIIYPAWEKAFKYFVVGGMIIFSMFQLWLFRDYPIIYQVMYVNLALSVIYLNGYLIMFAGLTTALFTSLGFMFWKDVFFPQVDMRLANIPIIIILQTSVVLWGGTKIGARFMDYIRNNQKMEQSLLENEQQLLLIQERNQALELYANQVEKLAVLEERNRVARELHDTMGHSLTSIIAGLEIIKHTTQREEELEVRRVDSLLLTARNGLENIRDHVHMADKIEDNETLLESITNLTNQFSLNTGVTIELLTSGEPYEMPSRRRLFLLRCVQESLTNAVRHGAANRIRVQIYYEQKEVSLRIEDNGKGTHQLEYGFGLQAIQSRIDELNGTLNISSGLESGTSIECRIPTYSNVSGDKIRLLLAEDQGLIAESFNILLDLEENLNVVGIAENGQVAVTWCEKEMPDVILMDIHMPIMDGIEATRIIKQRWPNVKIIILTTFHDVENASRAIAYGAEGYLLKSVQPKHLADAIRMVHTGGTLISIETAKLLMNEHETTQKTLQNNKLTKQIAINDLPTNHWLESLNEKEIEILNHLSDGLKYKDIATNMHYSEGTVKNYVSTIYSKLNVENRMQAVKKAQKMNPM